MRNNTSIMWAKINSLAGSHSSQSLGYHRPCPICKGLDSKTVLEINDFQFYSDSIKQPKRFDVRETLCHKCFAIYLNPCYSDYGFGVLFSEAGQSYGSMSEHTEEQIGWLGHHRLLSKGARVLDVGCYDGGFLTLLPDTVIKLGVDIDGPAIERGRLQHKEKEIQFFQGDFETFTYDHEAPDTITMYHVLEHLPRPVEVLSKLRSISNDSTKLVVEVPVLDNGNTNDINGFFSIQHTTHFSRNSLRNCLSAAGWHIETEFITSDYNGFRVLASPDSAKTTDKSINSAPEDWIDMHDSLMSWNKAVIDVEKIVQSIPQCDRFVIWGGGAHTEYLYQLTSLFHSRSHCEFIIVDSDPLKHGKTWRGITIYEPSIIDNLDWESTGLLISSYGGQDSIQEGALSLNVPSAKITKFYEAIRRY